MGTATKTLKEEYTHCRDPLNTELARLTRSNFDLFTSISALNLNNFLILAMVTVCPLTMSGTLVLAHQTLSKELVNFTMTETTKSLELFTGLDIDIRAKLTVMMYLVEASTIRTKEVMLAK